VDQDEDAAATLIGLLEDDGYRVARARNGHDAYELARAQPPDLIVLDLVLHDLDGLVLYVDLKLLTGAPVIVCSATKRRRDRPLGFRLGIDDFVPKPFEWEDLEGRIEAALRRSASRLPAIVAPPVPGAGDPTDVGAAGDRAPVDAVGLARRLGGLSVERSRHRTLVGGKSLALTPTEHRLLSALLSRPDEFVPRDELARTVWGYDDDGIGQAISVHMHRLRNKLTSAEWRGASRPEIKSVRGRGYSFSRAQPEGAAPAKNSAASRQAEGRLRLVEPASERVMVNGRAHHRPDD
jgi:DNA-binding response OmpR family regulator